MAAALPQKIGKYLIKSLLGEGAMGIVYEGFDPDIERRVAIKILHPHLVQDEHGEEFLERFKREAKSAARCTHPNIVTVLEYGFDSDAPYIVMEFVEGASLDQILKSGKKISLKNTLSIISQLLKALHSAHKLNIVHRDIKSANIMILKDGGSIKLADFGIARIAETSDLTMTGVVVGTPKFMAPEQMFGVKADNRADLFSATVVFMELLKALPNSAQFPLAMLPEIPGLPPNNRIDYTITYPSAFIPVLVKGLSASPEQRFQSAREFANTIKNAITHLKSATTDSSNDATMVAQRPSKAITENQDELDSMTRILVNYIGPIAKNIMQVQSNQYDSLGSLACAVAKEIPHADEREDFLRQWEESSGTRIDATQLHKPNTTEKKQQKTFNKEILADIRENYANYIGPLASRLVDHFASQTTSLEQLINQLAEEIPQHNDRQNFKDHWLH